MQAEGHRKEDIKLWFFQFELSCILGLTKPALTLPMTKLLCKYRVEKVERGKYLKNCNSQAVTKPEVSQAVVARTFGLSTWGVKAGDLCEWGQPD